MARHSSIEICGDDRLEQTLQHLVARGRQVPVDASVQLLACAMLVSERWKSVDDSKTARCELEGEPPVRLLQIDGLRIYPEAPGEPPELVTIDL